MMIPRFSLLIVFVTGLILLFNVGCKKDSFTTNSDDKLAFSTDTILFDTVFTRLGSSGNPRSINKRFIVYNQHNKSIKTTIYIGRGNASPFRINVNGKPTSHLKDYEILPNDSIYVFAEVTIDPNGGNNPLIEKDSIVFLTNGNTQDIKLVAWGQDAYYFSDSVLACNTSWMDNTKPYVIYDHVLVEENCKLTIGPGVKVYSDVNSFIFVAGTIEILGNNYDNRVILQGARLGKDFEELPGQWGGIHLLTKSRDNVLENAEIKNAFVGVRVDSSSVNANPKVSMNKVKIKNMSAVGVLGYTASIQLTNCEISNCGRFTLACDLGGDITARHCTFANTGSTFSRKDPSFLLSNADYKDQNNVIFSNPLKVSIVNNIIWGDLANEFTLFTDGSGAFSGTVDYNFIKTDAQGLPANNRINIHPKFADEGQKNYELDTLSPAINQGFNLGIFDDLKGKPRVGVPDIGAYERE